MEMKDSQFIPADQETVWQAINNPDILRASIPGCKELEKLEDGTMTATVVAKVGPVKATFKGEVSFENVNAPHSFSMVGEGKGGIAGFAKGGANVRLTPVEGGTQLDYDVDAKVGGKIAQLGSRLIDSAAKKLAGMFFTNFSNTVGGEE